MSSSCDQSKSTIDLPHVVLQEYLFPMLQFNDFMRLRRVSKAVKRLADDYLNYGNNGCPQEIEIVQGSSGRNLAAFLAMDIPATRMYLNNSDVRFFDDPNIPQFLEHHGSRITHLRLHHFSAFANITEKPFLETLTNLQHLEFEEIDATAWKSKMHKLTLENGQDAFRFSVAFNTFGQLKTLKFGHILPYCKEDQEYWMEIAQFCLKLEYIGHPWYDFSMPPQYNTHAELATALSIPPAQRIGLYYDKGPFAGTERFIDRRNKMPVDNKPIINYYDLEKFNYVRDGGGHCVDYLLLARTCFEYGVKLLNVHADLYQAMGPCSEDFFQSLTIPLISVKNLNRSMFQYELPNIEKVIITETSTSTYYPFWDTHQGKPQWPKLKTLDLMVDSTHLWKLWGLPVENQEVTELYDFLFTEVVRNELTDLAIRFDEKAASKNGGELPCPRTADIKRSCPNLVKLTLENWMGTNKALSLFWLGLPCLEELMLKDCKGLGNVAFVGEKKDQPKFLKLKRLKCLTLSGLELMPKITDTVFNLVFRHLQLKKLFLTSRRPVKTITGAGIRALLSGDFANTIEKFPFVEWSIAGSTPEEFTEMERQFRSYYMI